MSSSSMDKKINILHLEDSLKDSELIHSIIENGEIGHDYFLTDNEKGYLNILEKENIDLILADYNLPDYNGNEALKVAKDKYSHIPFIFVSGAIGEDAAINAMLNGAKDYVLKNKLERLVPAVKRALHENELEVMHKQAEAKLKEINANLTHAQRIAHIGSWNNYLPTNQLDWSEEMYRILGFPLNTPMNLEKVICVFPPKELKRFRNAVDAAINADVPYNIDYKIIQHDGAIRYIHDKGEVIRDEQGKAIWMLGTTKDITERKKSEINLKEKNKQIAVQNKKFVQINKELIFQNEEKEKRAAELIIANKELIFQNEEKEKRAAELIIANKELIFQNEEKEKRAAELIIANKELIFQNEEKEKRAAELIIAKEKAEESDRLKSAFLANMSHEIRTPMNGILGFAELLKEPKLTGEEQQEYISIIEKSGARMLNIINDIISISKVESGLMEISISETNINEQIVFIYTFFKPEAELKGIQISFKNSLPAKEAIIKTDREKIYAIFTNLVKNAIKFTHDGSIEFGYEKKGKYFEFFVKDTGIGIRQEQKEIIFRRFRQGSESLTRNYEGAGLGLSISKAYVKMLGGKIWVESEFGKGSIFYFTIPCNAESEEKNVIKDIDSADGEENQNNPEVSGLKILIAEDDEISEMLLRMAVKIFGKEILTVRTGVEAIEACRNNPDIDLILMDVKMPEMDGYTAARQIRQFNKDVVIIAQTAFGLVGDREKAIDAGCNDYIIKPIDVSLLKILIQKHFKK